MRAPVGFTTCDNKGFRVTFENGWAVSVQFGYGNYCENYDAEWRFEPPKAGVSSGDAEIAIINPDGELVKVFDGDSVEARQTPAQVLDYMNRAARGDFA